MDCTTFFFFWGGYLLFHYYFRKVRLKLEKLWSAVYIVAGVNRVTVHRVYKKNKNKKNPSLLTYQTASLFLTKGEKNHTHVTPALSITSLTAKRENTCQINCTEPLRESNTHSHRGTRVCVSLQPLISLAAGPSFRITLLSFQPQGAKLFKYSNSSSSSSHPPSLSFQHSATHNLSFHCCQFRGNPSH